MLRSGVLIGCVLGLVTALVLVVVLRGTERTPTPATRDMPVGERLAITLGRTSGMLAGAIIAAILTIGAGGRLMMRVMAITSPDAQGMLTDAEEVVGEVTLGGTIVLVVFIGLFAAVIGLGIFALLRRWLPDRSLVAGLAGAAIGAGLLVRASGLIDQDNPDFAILSPRALAVAMAVGMIVLFGLTFGVLVDRFAPRWPRPARSVKGVASLLPLLILLPAAAVALPAVLAIVAATAVPAPDLRRFDRVGRVLAGGLAFVGGAATLLAAGEVLAL